MGTQKIAISDQEEGFTDRSERSDSFVVDMESLFYSNHKDISANSRITLQRSLSRKGSQRGERKITSERDTTSSAGVVVADGSPKAALIGGCTPEKSVRVHVVGVGTTVPTITAQGPQIITTNAESRWRRYGKQQSPWIDPRRILFFFATLSSMGTIILIYFALSISKLNEDEAR